MDRDMEIEFDEVGTNIGFVLAAYLRRADRNTPINVEDILAVGYASPSRMIDDAPFVFCYCTDTTMRLFVQWRMPPGHRMRTHGKMIDDSKSWQIMSTSEKEEWIVGIPEMLTRLCDHSFEQYEFVPVLMRGHDAQEFAATCLLENPLRKSDSAAHEWTAINSNRYANAMGWVIEYDSIVQEWLVFPPGVDENRGIFASYPSEERAKAAVENGIETQDIDGPHNWPDQEPCVRVPLDPTSAIDDPDMIAAINAAIRKAGPTDGRPAQML